MLNIQSGNCEIETISTRGWLIGHFIDKKSPLNTEDFELKWGNHFKGDKKIGGAAQNNEAKSLAILISGKFQFYFPEENTTVILKEKGDFLFWPSKVSHDWEALDDTTIVTVRWPSKAKDQS